MQARSIKIGWYLVVLLFALFIFVVNEKIALMVVGGVGLISLILGVMKYILGRLEDIKDNEG